MVEFIEEEHIYLVNGVIVPSVSQIIKWHLGNEYLNVSGEVLEAKREYGTELHSLIEKYEKGTSLEKIMFMNKDPQLKVSVYQYQALKDFEVKDMEKIIYCDRLAGRYDILTTNDEIVDIKSTYRINEEHLKWQIGFYYYLLGIEKDYGYVMWLPKHTKGKLKRIDNYSVKECENLLDKYEKEFTN